jgi:hypothetical protein
LNRKSGKPPDSLQVQARNKRNWSYKTGMKRWGQCELLADYFLMARIQVGVVVVVVVVVVVCVCVCEQS